MTSSVLRAAALCLLAAPVLGAAAADTEVEVSTAVPPPPVPWKSKSLEALLEKRYEVDLRASSSSCSCPQYEVARKGEKLGPLKAPGPSACAEEEAGLEAGLRRLLKLPEPQAGRPAGIAVSISADAQALMKRRHATLDGGALHVPGRRAVGIDLNGDGKTRSVVILVDADDADALVVTAVNEDGTRESVKIPDGADAKEAKAKP